MGEARRTQRVGAPEQLLPPVSGLGGRRRLDRLAIHTARGPVYSRRVRVCRIAAIIPSDAYIVYAPDTCSAHGAVVSCSLTGVLDPPNATGYPVCDVVYNQGDDD